MDRRLLAFLIAVSMGMSLAAGAASAALGATLYMAYPVILYVCSPLCAAYLHRQVMGVRVSRSMAAKTAYVYSSIVASVSFLSVVLAVDRLGTNLAAPERKAELVLVFLFAAVVFGLIGAFVTRYCIEIVQERFEK